MNGQSTKLAPKALMAMVVVLFLAAPLFLIGVQQAEAVNAKVVVFDAVIVHNRLGAQNENGMMYALERDVVADDTALRFCNGNGASNRSQECTVDADCPDLLDPFEAGTCGDARGAGNVILRPDKRPRPLVLRVNSGEELEVTLTNLLDPAANPDPPLPEGANDNTRDLMLDINDQVAGRCVGFHPQGLQLTSIADDSSHVGLNEPSLVCPGESATYTFQAEGEGARLVTSYGQTFGGEASGGNVGVGLFASVNVEPPGSTFYRSQVTEEELRLAINTTSPNSCAEPNTPGYTCLGQPIIDYEARYPTTGVWADEGKGGLPILNMVDANEIVHSDINAIITGDYSYGPDGTYPMYNPTVPNRLEAFREFTSIFHDENAVTQAFPGWFSHPVTSHTLHGVRDSFMINYGSGGIGSEIIANRLGVGPMWDCLDCAYEEFFLTSFTVGDPAMIVDVPANLGLEQCDPALNNCLNVEGEPARLGPKANQAFFPDDPANIHHSYTGDFAKFRNLHAGPKEQHIFHLHNHQWLFNSNDDNSNYLDAQGIGPGSGYTYEINYGGSGNRNKTAGDAIYHCHFYPHFAQGMWYLWRVHDVMETGTLLAVSGGPDSFHGTAFDLLYGEPALHPDAGVGLPEGTRVRALPDGEILAGTPIPAVVPLPNKPMPPMPGRVVIVTKDVNEDTQADSSQAHVIDRGINPGFPFWIAGVDCGDDPNTQAFECPLGIVGQRPATPPLDMLTKDEATALQARTLPDGVTPDPLWQHPGLEAGAGGWDGGLPRHALEGYFALGQNDVTTARALATGIVHQEQTRLDFSKEILRAKPVYYPEEGTDLEQTAMKYHAIREHPTCLPDGTCNENVNFITNGAPPVSSAPYHEPCIDDDGTLNEVTGRYFSGGGFSGRFDSSTYQYSALEPRVYAGANIQFDAVFNKLGYHYPQQRIIALWGDVEGIITKDQPPEPLVMRLNSFDCAKYLHANLVPREFALDDYQVRTPTDIIGQHIHLPKWDLTTTDGAANGWNYEDGTLSPGTVVERIEAINDYNEIAAADDTDILEPVPTIPKPDGTGAGLVELDPATHPYFGNGIEGNTDWLGARTTIQRWFADPVVNSANEDRGLGIIFTHDHYGPSTHQQIGLYATVLTEPADSTWVHNETGEILGGRNLENAVYPTDGGPTSWQAVIIPAEATGPGYPASNEPYREFYLEFSDFQHAYQPGVYIGAGPDGRPGEPGDFPPTPDSFRDAINPSVRQEASPVFPDIVQYPLICNQDAPPEFQVTRPCPEAISADDIGMFVVNYRNEPIGLRVYDPDKLGPDGKPGTQADGNKGDLAFALASLQNRAIPEMNVQPIGGTDINGTVFPPPINAAGVGPGDPFTPMMRAYSGDLVRVKVQTGATEHEHNVTMHGVKWLQGGSGHGEAPNSGWRNAQGAGISEQFTFSMPVNAKLRQRGAIADHAYNVSAGQDGWWGGTWGIMRNYRANAPELDPLSNNDPRQALLIARLNARNFKDGVCPITAPDLSYDITAVLANDVLGNDILDPNDGTPLITIPDNQPAGPRAPGFIANDNEGGPLNPAGGTLVYNPRNTALNALGPDGLPVGVVGAGPIHDPTAIMYVMTDDLEPDPADTACPEVTDEAAVRNPICLVKLKADAPVEPITLRAAAGDCIHVTLRNRLPEVVPDLPGFNTQMQLVRRDPGVGAQGMTTFNNNLVRPSKWVGIHPQLVEYDVTSDDGTIVGTNPNQLVGPGGVRTYHYYAGLIERDGLTLVANAVELGGSNLSPADKIKQGQKGLVGALIIEPADATWDELDEVLDRQNPGNLRKTRASATVNPDEPGEFRDFAVVFQKGLNQRLADSSPVPNIAGEGGLIPEDSHDAGQAGINYGTEPMWFRFGMAANTPFGVMGKSAVAEAHAKDAYSNFLDTGDGPVGEPATPIFTAEPNQFIRMRVLMPFGVGRGSTFNLHGHVWQRDPYLEGAVPSQTIGHNPYGMYLGGQESVTPYQHFDIVSESAENVTGDMLFRDHGSFGNTDGLWGILRVDGAAPAQ